MTSGFTFSVEATDGTARVGRFVTPRVTVDTPAFMPVGTQGTVKGLTPDEVAGTGARICLANTYHLWLRPGAELVREMGGLHHWMDWPHAVLTDSGGYQVYSLAKLRDIDDDGITFRSHLDGGLKRLTPELAMDIQAALGSDIAMVLDECPPGAAERNEVERAMRRSTAWAKRCLSVSGSDQQARFGIVQGATYLDLRFRHLAEIASLPVDGVALGGFSVGEPIGARDEVLAELGPALPAEKPRYLMGVGTPRDVLLSVAAGIDLFDCVLPTRNARNGQALTWHGRVNMRQARHVRDTGPLDPRCDCFTCSRFSRSYLHHLFRAKEMLGPRLLSLHNLHFYGALMTAVRAHVAAGTYLGFMRETLAAFEQGDEISCA